MENFKLLIKKLCTREIILYVVFGLFTTVVNIGTFYILTNFLKLEENLSNFIAIILAILFAYITNRKLVFNSKACSIKDYCIEFFKFMLGRAFTLFFEFFSCALLFSILNISDIIIKIAISIIVIIMNFFISKFFAFKK